MDFEFVTIFTVIELVLLLAAGLFDRYVKNHRNESSSVVEEYQVHTGSFQDTVVRSNEICECHDNSRSKNVSAGKEQVVLERPAYHESISMNRTVDPMAEIRKEIDPMWEIRKEIGL